MPVAQQLDRRAEHLLAASRLFTRSNPELSSFLGFQLNEYAAESSQKARAAASLQKFCVACGMEQIPGRSAMVTVETRRPKGRAEALGGRSRGAGSGKSRTTGGTRSKSGLRIRSTLKITCRSCRRFTVEPLQKPGKPRGEPAAQAPTIDARRQVGTATNQARATATSTGAGAEEKKARRRQKKGGLAAMLALAKASESSKSSAPSLGFADFASRR